MLFILFSIIFFSIILCGWGMLITRFFGAKNNPENPLLLFFIGYGVIIIFIEYVAFFKKIDSVVLAIIAAVGIFGFIFFFKKIKSAFADFSKTSRVAFYLLAILFLLNISVSLGGKSFPKAGDTTGYHMGIVSWLNNFPLVPGLANLHFRLGNYSGYLQFAAVMDNYKWDNLSPFVMPGLFFFNFIMYFAWEIISSIGKKIKSKPVIWRICYAIPILLSNVVYYFVTYNSAPNLYYDLLPMFLVAIIVNEIMNYFLETEENDKKNVFLIHLTFIVNLLSVAAYLSKQNSAVVVLMVGVLSLYLLSVNKLLRIKNLFILYFLPCVGFLGSVLTNLVTSGYPLFPLPFFYVNFSWTAPSSLVMEAYNAIRYWAKLPGANYMTVANNGFLYWFIPWIKRNLADRLFLGMVFVPFILGLIFWLSSIFFYIKKQKKYYWLFLASMFNLLYWFLLAPDIRFGIIFFIIFFSSGLAFFAISTGNRLVFFNRLINKNTFLMLILFIGVTSTLLFDTSDFKKRMKKTNKYVYVSFQDTNKFYEKPMKTKGGNDIVVYIPKDNECRSMPLPCTPYYSEKVKAFDGKNLGAGFYYDQAKL